MSHEWIMVDVESDGPCPGLYSMIEIGAVSVSDPNKVFYGTFKPISEKFLPAALKVTGYSREQTLKFEQPLKTMQKFSSWLSTFNSDRLVFISDNNGFDWQFVNYYFHYYLGENPFGYSSRNLGDLYKGCVQNLRKNFKHLRTTKHTHHPVDDARGNVEAFLRIKNQFHL